MGTKNKPGTFDCYNAAEPDEPMFILLGRDPLAPALVEEWANQREQARGRGAKVEEARACAAAMRAWASGTCEPRPVEVFINGRSVEICAADVTYEQIAGLAGKTGTPSMTWRLRNDPENRDGILSPGGRLPLREGLVFNVQHTGDA